MEPGKIIRLVLADDQPLDLAGLRSLLGNVPGLKIVGEVDTATNVLAVLRSTRPDLIIIDLKWHGSTKTGARIISEIRGEFPEIKILAQTNFEPLIEEALENGADVAVAKTYSRDKLIEFITSLCSDSVGAAESKRTSPISSRELQILHLIAGGQTDRAIAQALLISPNTVRRHVANIFEKLGVSSRAQAVQKANEENLL